MVDCTYYRVDLLGDGAQEHGKRHVLLVPKTCV